MKRRFKVIGKLDNSRPMLGTVTIDEHGLFHVRPCRRRREYILPLSTVADMVVLRVIRAEVFEKRLGRAKKAGVRR